MGTETEVEAEAQLLSGAATSSQCGTHGTPAPRMSGGSDVAPNGGGVGDCEGGGDVGDSMQRRGLVDVVSLPSGKAGGSSGSGCPVALTCADVVLPEINGQSLHEDGGDLPPVVSTRVPLSPPPGPICDSLPPSHAALLTHVQERAMNAASDRVASRLVNVVRALTPRIFAGNKEVEIKGIDLPAVQSLCASGLPDEVPALRAAVWKVVLGYLPTDVFQWDTFLAASRASYNDFVAEMLQHLGDERPATQDNGNAASQERNGLRGINASDDQHVEPEDLKYTLEQINKDIYRTRSELDFFARRVDGSEETESPEERPAFRGGQGRVMQDVDVYKPRRHYDALARVLLLYGRLNPCIRYVQGMNELCAPLYYLFAQDPLRRDDDDVEADTFYCFNLLMSGMRDAFVKSLDHTDGGMIGRIGQFHDLLKLKDPEVWLHLEQQQVSPLYYSVRWLTLMLTQELEMPDVLRVWDSLLSDDSSPRPLLLYLCVARVTWIRTSILAADFTECMHLFQEYPSQPVDELLHDANRMKAEDLLAEGPSTATAAAGDSGVVDSATKEVWATRLQMPSNSLKSALTATQTPNKGLSLPPGSGRRRPAWMHKVGRWLDGALPERKRI
eukprot:TRINITY_DN5550_c0_g1_i3.p1 TRINITY_DN5550_c0_g1~~TRINITY_DN5550_c0_g1_i3.p1  ORF type:complete len:615 (-),score=100.42 TRINITY_DN5550_c0_g1_i3:104-1948(-)